MIREDFRGFIFCFLKPQLVKKKMLKSSSESQESKAKSSENEKAPSQKLDLNPPIDLYPDLLRAYENQGHPYLTPTPNQAPTPNNTLRKGEKFKGTIPKDHEDCYPSIIKLIENSGNKEEIEKLHKLEHIV